MDMPQKQDHETNLVSFTSISSESGLDTVNIGQDTVDAVPRRPLKILRMALLGEDYLQQCSVENPFLSRAPSRSVSRSSSQNAGSFKENPNSDPTDLGELLSTSPLLSTEHADPESYSYFEMREQDQAHYLNNHAKLRLPQAMSDAGTTNTVNQPRSTEESIQLAGNAAQSGTNNPSKSVFQGVKNRHDPTDENVTEVDLVASRQPKPSLYNIQRKISTDSEEDTFSQQGRCAVVSTPPRNVQSQPPEELHGCCKSTGPRLCHALFMWKYLCSRFSIMDFCLTLFSIGLFIFDVVTDLFLSLTYFRKIDEHEDYRFFFSLTLGLVIGPSLVVQCFSYFWVWDDFRQKKEQEKQLRNGICTKIYAKDIFKFFLCFLVHIFQGAVLFRYIRVLVFGFRSRYYEVKKMEVYRKHFDTLWKCELQDINVLRLLESFLESAPQLVLQIYIMLVTKEVEFINVISCIASLLSLSSMMVLIQRAIRNANPRKTQLSIPASIVMFYWRLFTISSRVLAFALFLTIQPLAFLVFILSHWALATVWIALKGTNFCTKKAAEYFFNGICGIIYIFCFFNVHEDKDGRNSHSRWRMLVFYLVVITENSVLSILWFFLRPGRDTRPVTSADSIEGIWQADVLTKTSPPPLSPTKSFGFIHMAYALSLIVAVHGFFVLGMMCMLVYYTFLHPRKTNNVCCCLAPQRQRREVEEKLVTASAGERKKVNPPAIARTRSTTQYSTPLRGVQAGGTLSLQRGQEAQQLLHRREGPSTASDDDSDQEARADLGEWSKTMFNRGKRARKIYSRQYSREKLLVKDDNKTLTRNDQDSPRRTERFRTIETPVREKRSEMVTEPKVRSSVSEESSTIQRNNLRPIMPSVVIRPGSQASRPRSATHQALRSCVQPSPSRQVPGPHKRPLRNLSGPIKSRGYSASMSCLGDGRARPYAAGRMQPLDSDEPSASTFTIGEGEVVECMESSV